MEEIETSQDGDEFVPYLEFPQIRQGHPKQSRRREDQNPQRERRIDGKSVNRGHGDPTTRFCSAVVRAGESSRTLRRGNLQPNQGSARSSLWTERGRRHRGRAGGRNSQAACSISPAAFGGPSDFGVRLWPFCSWASTVFKASISFDFWTAAISRTIRSRAASYNCRSEYDCSGWASDR